MSNFEEKIKILYYKKGRRYYEYIKNKEIPNNQLYYIDNGEFVPYDAMTMDWYTYRGRLKNGIWKVCNNGSTYIGDYGMGEFRIKFEKYRDLLVKCIVQALENSEGKYMNAHGITTEIMNELSKYEKSFLEENS